MLLFSILIYSSFKNYSSNLENPDIFLIYLIVYLLNIDIGLAVTADRETWVQSQVESYQRLKKWYLMPPLSIIRYGSRVKWSNPGKGVVPSSTPWCSSYRKGNLRVTLDYCRQLYLLIEKADNKNCNETIFLLEMFYIFIAIKYTVDWLKGNFC